MLLHPNYRALFLFKDWDTTALRKRDHAKSASAAMTDVDPYTVTAALGRLASVEVLEILQPVDASALMAENFEGDSFL
eukprot:IDg7245t1